MLSAPNYGLAIPTLQCLKWETAIANAVIDNMKENDGIYIPTNLQKDVLPMFHTDNIDWLKDTPDGKNTSHYLQMSIFQRKIQELLPIKLNIKKEETESLKLKSNSFNEILPYQKPNKSQFQQSPGCEIFADHMTFVLLPYLIFGLLSGLLDELCLKMIPLYNHHQGNSICSVSITIFTVSRFRHYQC